MRYFDRLDLKKVYSNSQLQVKAQGKGSQSDQTFKESDTFHLSCEVALQGSQQYPFSSVGFMVPWGPLTLGNKCPPHKVLYLVAWYKQEDPRGVKWFWIPLNEMIEMIRLYITIARDIQDVCCCIPVKYCLISAHLGLKVSVFIPSMIVNSEWQPDRITEGTSPRVCLWGTDQTGLTEMGRAILSTGRHPLGWSSWANEKKKTNWAAASVSLCFLWPQGGQVVHVRAAMTPLP